MGHPVSCFSLRPDHEIARACNENHQDKDRPKTGEELSAQLHGSNLPGNGGDPGFKFRENRARVMDGMPFNLGVFPAGAILGN